VAKRDDRHTQQLCHSVTAAAVRLAPPPRRLFFRRPPNHLKAETGVSSSLRIEAGGADPDRSAAAPNGLPEPAAFLAPIRVALGMRNKNKYMRFATARDRDSDSSKPSRSECDYSHDGRGVRCHLAEKATIRSGSRKVARGKNAHRVYGDEQSIRTLICCSFPVPGMKRKRKRRN